MKVTSSDTKEIERIAQQLGLDITLLCKEILWSLGEVRINQVMISLLPDIMQRCDFYESFTYNTTTFSRQLEPLVGLALLGDWSKSAVEDSISVRPRRAMFFGQLKEA